jgi:hypothetical protein
MNIEKTGNELIAEFMGGKLVSYESYHLTLWGWTGTPANTIYKTYVKTDELLYETSWDWLHPVLEKIGNMMHDPNEPVPYTLEFKWELEKVLLLPICSHIQQVTKAVIQFIKWYSTQTPKLPWNK